MRAGRRCGSMSGVEAVRYARSPRDVLHLVVCEVAALLLVAAAAWAEDAIIGSEQDLLRLLDFLPTTLGRLLTGVVQLLSAVALLAGIVIPVVQRRLRLLGYVVLASLGSLLVMIPLDAVVR